MVREIALGQDAEEPEQVPADGCRGVEDEWEEGGEDETYGLGRWEVGWLRSQG